MSGEIFDVMLAAMGMLLEPERLWYVFLGTFFGILLAVIPGLGGLVGIAILLPFTFGMDAYSGIAFMLGVITVMSTSDTIPAVLFGVPGTPTSMATVLDGYPMSKRGEAGRALGAAFSSSIIGGLIGAFVLLLIIPVLIPVMMSLRAAEMLAFCIMGLAMVAALSGSSLPKGLAAGAIGALLATIGQDSQSATMRWTFDSLYLWDGVHVLVVALALYAVPELADIAIKRSAISSDQDARLQVTQRRDRGVMQGFRDTRKNMKIVTRSSGISSLLGIVPALGPAVIPWIVYSLTVRTTKGESQFGNGDVRGVIATESSNNATVGGSLVPTIALGIPGSAPMALLLGVFMLHGIAPGPDMLTRNLDLTYLMVWTIVLANVVGGLMAFMLSNQLARIVKVRAAILVPLVMAIVFIGALQSSRQWEDIYFLLGLGVLGWLMKRARWSRAPLILAFVLMPLVENYYYIATGIHGWEWMLRPIPATVLALTALGLLIMMIARSRATISSLSGGRWTLVPNWSMRTWMPVALLAVGVVAYWTTLDWPFRAAVVPRSILVIAMVMSAVALLNEWYVIKKHPSAEPAEKEVHYDIETDFGDLSLRQIWWRALVFIAWLVGFLLLARAIGIVPAIGPFVIGYIWWQRERWVTAVLVGSVFWLFSWFLFEQFLRLAWPIPWWSLSSLVPGGL